MGDHARKRRGPIGLLCERRWFPQIISWVAAAMWLLTPVVFILDYLIMAAAGSETGVLVGYLVLAAWMFTAVVLALISVVGWVLYLAGWIKP